MDAKADAGEDQEQKREDVVPARVLCLSKILSGLNTPLPAVFIGFGSIDPTPNPPRHTSRHGHQQDDKEGEQSAGGQLAEVFEFR